MALLPRPRDMAPELRILAQCELYFWVTGACRLTGYLLLIFAVFQYPQWYFLLCFNDIYSLDVQRERPGYS